MNKFILVIVSLITFFTRSFFLYLLWNSTMIDVFNVSTITYVNSMGLLIISELLFKQKDIKIND